MLPVQGWKIYRSDGSVYTSADGVAGVPDGIQIVVWYHAPPYRTLEWGEDIYTVDGRTFTGVWMAEPEFYALCDRAFNDREWP